MDTIFSKIISQEIAADLVYQDQMITAFKDINPQAPIHILIIPNKVIPTVNDVKIEDELLLGKLITCAKMLAEKFNIAKDGYRLIINCNEHGGQEVYHLHMHLVGGCNLGPMLPKHC